MVHLKNKCKKWLGAEYEFPISLIIISVEMAFISFLPVYWKVNMWNFYEWFDELESAGLTARGIPAEDEAHIPSNFVFSALGCGSLALVTGR